MYKKQGSLKNNRVKMIKEENVLKHREYALEILENGKYLYVIYV